MAIQQMLLGLGGAGDGQWISYLDQGFQANSGYTTHGDYKQYRLNHVCIYNKHIWAEVTLNKIGTNDEQRPAIIKMKTDGTLVDTLFMDTTVANGYMILYNWTVDHDDNLYVMTGATWGTKRTYLAKYDSSFSQQFKVKLGPDLDSEAFGSAGHMLYVPSTNYGNSAYAHSILTTLADGWCFINASNGTPGDYVETNWDEGIRINGYSSDNPVHIGDGVIYNTVMHKNSSSYNKRVITLIQMDKGDRSLDRVSPDGIDDYAKSPNATNINGTNTGQFRANDYKLIGGKKYIYHIDTTDKSSGEEPTFLVWRYNVTDDATTMYGGVAHSTSTNSTAGTGCIKADKDGNLWGLLQYYGDSAFERDTSSNGKWAYEMFIVKWNTGGTLVTNWRVRFDEDAFPENWETERTHNIVPAGIDICSDGDLMVSFNVNGSQAWWHSNYTGTQSAFEHGSGVDFNVIMKIKTDGSNLGTHGWITIANQAIPNSPGNHPSVSDLDDGPGYSNTSGAFATSMQSGNGFAVQSSNNTQDSHSNSSYDSDYSYWSVINTEL